MIHSSELIQSMPALREQLLNESSMEAIVHQAGAKNPWFTPEFVKLAVEAIATNFLSEDSCRKWLESYPTKEGPGKSVAIVMAGNLPLVGFHDLFSVLMSGHQAIVKLSDKDSVLLPWLTEQWSTILPSVRDHIQYTPKLENFDAVIATGSNNSSRYFEYYFGKYPNILRRNRNGVAILRGNESLKELKALAKDIFQYFGLGCRNVSKIYVPEGYDFGPWKEAVEDWAYLADHHKYKNNLEYNFALYIINSISHNNLGPIILKEDTAIASRIGSLNYSYYITENQLTDELDVKREEIQCVVSTSPLSGWDHVPFGESQQPRLDQYADGIDTMAFLSAL